MNYLVAFIVCLLGTASAMASDSPNLHSLLISDFNVALALATAWFLDGKIKAVQFNIVHWRRDDVNSDKH